MKLILYLKYFLSYLIYCSSIPVECLHTILLGASKYMLRSFMDKATPSMKKEILARIGSFPYCGFSCHITGNICYYYKSFVGRDFKAWMQMAVFILEHYLSASELECWLLLSKVSFIYKLYYMES